MPGFDLAAKERGIKVMFAGLSACPPLIGADRLGRDNSINCRAFNDAVIAHLEGRNDIEKVILVGRWALAEQGLRAPGEPGPPAILIDDVTATGAPERNSEVFARGLTATVDSIRASGREVIIVESIPEAPVDVPRALATAHHWGIELKHFTSFDDYTARNKGVKAVIDALTSRPGVRSVTLTDTLRTPVCQQSRGGLPLYRDAHHLTRSAAETLVSPSLANGIWKTQ